MRFDTVGQILTYSNVHAHSNMVIMETTQGLLLAAMLERMGGETVEGNVQCTSYSVLSSRTILCVWHTDWSLYTPMCRFSMSQGLATWFRFSLEIFQSSE